MSSNIDKFEQKLVQFCFVESKQLSLTKDQIAAALTKVGDQLKKNAGL